MSVQTLNALLRAAFSSHSLCESHVFLKFFLMMVSDIFGRYIFIVYMKTADF